MVGAIAAANRDPHCALHGKALGKLANIRIDKADFEMAEDILLYSPFLGLPSVRLLSGCMIDSNDGNRPFEHPHQPPGIVVPHQIEEINMGYSAIGLDRWDWMLRYIGNLRKFTYHHAVGNLGSTEFNQGGIVALLKKYASHSLVKLALTGEPTGNHSTGHVQEQFIGDLKDFQKLRVLRIHDTAFHEKTYGEIVRLVDVLPASITTVTLLNKIEKGNPIDLFLGLAKGKKDKLPQLKKLMLHGGFSLQQDLVAELGGVGIEITGLGWQNS
ncbi:MAG: hypothetical protein Q9207_000015 [Kuettlingeria erythrocarpa]